MKILWFLSLIYTLVLANQTQIVVGSYSSVQNAARAQKELNAFINKNSELQEFFIKHSLTTKYKENKKYFRVVVEPFNDLQTLNKALKELKSTFKDAYTMPLTEEKSISENKNIQKTLIKKPILKETISKKTIIKNETPEKSLPSKTTLAIEPEISTIKIEPEVQDTSPKSSQEEKQESVFEEQQQSNLQNINYFILSGAVFIIFAIVIYFLRRETKYKRLIMHQNMHNALKEDDLFQKMMERNNSRKVEKVNENKDATEMLFEEISETISFDILIDDTQDDILENDDTLKENINKK
jgi:hypothetical protein